MSMKKLADEAIEFLNDKMQNLDSLQPTEQDVYMAALVCRVRELEEHLNTSKSEVKAPYRMNL